MISRTIFSLFLFIWKIVCESEFLGIEKSELLQRSQSELKHTIFEFKANTPRKLMMITDKPGFVYLGVDQLLNEPYNPKVYPDQQKIQFLVDKSALADQAQFNTQILLTNSDPSFSNLIDLGVEKLSMSGIFELDKSQYKVGVVEHNVYSEFHKIVPAIKLVKTDNPLVPTKTYLYIIQYQYLTVNKPNISIFNFPPTQNSLSVIIYDVSDVEDVAPMIFSVSSNQNVINPTLYSERKYLIKVQGYNDLINGFVLKPIEVVVNYQDFQNGLELTFEQDFNPSYTAIFSINDFFGDDSITCEFSSKEGQFLYENINISPQNTQFFFNIHENSPIYLTCPDTNTWTVYASSNYLSIDNQQIYLYPQSKLANFYATFNSTDIAKFIVLKAPANVITINFYALNNPSEILKRFSFPLDLGMITLSMTNLLPNKYVLKIDANSIPTVDKWLIPNVVPETFDLQVGKTSVYLQFAINTSEFTIYFSNIPQANLPFSFNIYNTVGYNQTVSKNLTATDNLMVFKNIVRGISYSVNVYGYNDISRKLFVNQLYLTFILNDATNYMKANFTYVESSQLYIKNIFFSGYTGDSLPLILSSPYSLSNNENLIITKNLLNGVYILPNRLLTLNCDVNSGWSCPSVTLLNDTQDIYLDLTDLKNTITTGLYFKIASSVLLNKGTASNYAQNIRGYISNVVPDGMLRPTVIYKQFTFTPSNDIIVITFPDLPVGKYIFSISSDSLATGVTTLYSPNTDGTLDIFQGTVTYASIVFDFIPYITIYNIPKNAKDLNWKINDYYGNLAQNGSVPINSTSYTINLNKLNYTIINPPNTLVDPTNTLLSSNYYFTAKGFFDNINKIYFAPLTANFTVYYGFFRTLFYANETNVYKVTFFYNSVPDTKLSFKSNNYIYSDLSLFTTTTSSILQFPTTDQIEITVTTPSNYVYQLSSKLITPNFPNITLNFTQLFNVTLRVNVGTLYPEGSQTTNFSKYLPIQGEIKNDLFSQKFLISTNFTTTGVQETLLSNIPKGNYLITINNSTLPVSTTGFYNLTLDNLGLVNLNTSMSVNGNFALVANGYSLKLSLNTSSLINYKDNLTITISLGNTNTAVGGTSPSRIYSRNFITKDQKYDVIFDGIPAANYTIYLDSTTIVPSYLGTLSLAIQNIVNLNNSLTLSGSLNFIPIYVGSFALVLPPSTQINIAATAFKITASLTNQISSLITYFSLTGNNTYTTISNLNSANYTLKLDQSTYPLIDGSNISCAYSSILNVTSNFTLPLIICTKVNTPSTTTVIGVSLTNINSITSGYPIVGYYYPSTPTTTAAQNGTFRGDPGLNTVTIPGLTAGRSYYFVVYASGNVSTLNKSANSTTILATAPTSGITAKSISIQLLTSSSSTTLAKVTIINSNYDLMKNLTIRCNSPKSSYSPYNLISNSATLYLPKIKDLYNFIVDPITGYSISVTPDSLNTTISATATITISIK